MKLDSITVLSVSVYLLGIVMMLHVAFGHQRPSCCVFGSGDNCSFEYRSNIPDSMRMNPCGYRVGEVE